MTLVTLRAQISETLTSGGLALRVANNEATESSLQVLWQQAWGGRDGDSTYPLAGALANAGFVRTPANAPVQNTYPWAVNAIGIKAAGRFQLPLLDTNTTTGDAAGMGWKSPNTLDTAADLQDGEAYYDDWQKAVLARMAGGWFTFHQPDRVSTNPSTPLNWDPGTAKNIVFSSNGAKSVTLPTALSDIAPGSVVRVFNFQSFQPGNSVTVTFGGGSSTTLPEGTMCEYLFYDDGGTGRWLITQLNVAAAKKP